LAISVSVIRLSVERVCECGQTSKRVVYVSVVCVSVGRLYPLSVSMVRLRMHCVSVVTRKVHCLGAWSY